MEEIWKSVTGFERYYKVSSFGRVLSLRRNKIMSPDLSRQGYPCVFLKGKNKKRRVFIHRLVCEEFIPNTENKLQIDHINTIRTDNRVENLRWVTATENINNPITLAKHIGSKRSKETIDKMRLAQPKMKKVICIEKAKTFFSLAEAGRFCNTQWVNIRKVCEGERSKAGGYSWKYV